jgi:microcystin-dependent protein
MPYVGEIRMVGFSFPPSGWALCQGQTLPISENETLFQLIGTTYGGDGETTFNLPNLASRVPIHQGTGPSGTTYVLAEMAGEEQVTLTTQQMPTHNHQLAATTNIANETGPDQNVLAQSSAAKMYIQDTPTAQLAPNTISVDGGSQPHENMQPFLVINYIISLFGIFPSPT